MFLMIIGGVFVIVGIIGIFGGDSPVEFLLALLIGINAFGLGNIALEIKKKK